MQMSDTPTGEDLKSLQESLASIVSQTSADASHAAYHAKHLQLLLHNLEQQTARSVNSRLVALHPVFFVQVSQLSLQPARSMFHASAVLKACQHAEQRACCKAMTPWKHGDMSVSLEHVWLHDVVLISMAA